MRTALVVPCYNEEARLDSDALATLLDDSSVDLILVDDGSSDSTRSLLQRLAEQHRARIQVVALDHNQGKGEAVRHGLLAALGGNYAFTGYLDADLATPPDEIHRLLEILRNGSAHVVLGARVALLGRAIERRAARHYAGRVFGTLASLTLRAAIYDTQCGAKLFRVTPTLHEAVSEPFISRWAFDIELLGRVLLDETAQVWEEPLRTWRDVAGSKLSLTHMANATIDLVRISRDFARRRQAALRRRRL